MSIGTLESFCTGVQADECVHLALGRSERKTWNYRGYSDQSLTAEDQAGQRASIDSWAMQIQMSWNSG